MTPHWQNPFQHSPLMGERPDYELLSNVDLEQCVEIFVEAREIARETLLEEIEKLKRKGARIRKGSRHRPRHRTALLEKK